VGEQEYALTYLNAKNGTLGREAALVLGHHRKLDRLKHLAGALNECPPDDAHRIHALKMAVRDCLAVLQSPREFDVTRLGANERRRIAEICAAVPTATAAVILLEHLKTSDEPVGTRNLYLHHAARHAASESLEELVALARVQFAGDIDAQGQAIQAVAAGVLQRGGVLNANLTSWSEEVVGKLLETTARDSLGWTAVPVEGKPASESPWVIAARPCADGVNDQPFYYSLPKGEQRTGIYRSGPFAIPEKLSFWCCGHSGFPTVPLNEGNYVRLRDATTHAILAESRPPRNDTAQRFEWDIKEHAGKQGYVELIDGDTASAYAWLAVGRFSLAALNPSDTAKKQQLAAEIVGKQKLAALRPQLATLVAAPNTDGAARVAIAQALLSFEPSARAAALVSALNEPAIPNDLRVATGAILARSASEGNAAETQEVAKLYLENLREVMKLAPSRLQTTIAETLAGDAAGAEALLALIESGHASPRLLLAPNVSAKFGTLKNDALDKRVATLTAKLPPVSETLDKLILERRASFARATPNLEKGLAVFTKHCAGCHQIEGKGSVVGPQLDGIGGRGLERIIEDILDPNRNVDVAFRTTTIRKIDGQIVSGLFRREEGVQLVFADKEGKEFTLAKDDIDEQQKTNLSLMPANVPEIVPEADFQDLIGFLLSKRAAPKKE
jgi:putative heme-binding domain-containing protein